MLKAAISVAVLAAAAAYWLLRDDYGAKTPEQLSAKYDYIVVGAGSAGAALASRLAAEYPVLLLEAGGSPSWPIVYSHWPGFAAFNMHTSIDRNYSSAPIDELHGRRMLYPRGKVLGGTSVLNYMVANVGRPADYDALPDGWKFKDVRKHLDRVLEEQVTLGENIPFFSDKFHDFHDYNDLNDDGTGKFAMHAMRYFIKEGVRMSSANAFLLPAARRHPDNLHIVTGATVTKVNIEGKRAVSVSFVHGGKRYEVSAEHEIVLSAGAVDSPKLLMLSGVGPAKQLKKHNIPVKHALEPVGRNLKDHTLFSLSYAHADSAGVLGADKIGVEPVATVKQVLQYVLFGTGNFAIPGVCSVGFATTERARQRGKVRDLQFYAFNADYLMNGRAKHLADFTVIPGVYESGAAPPEGHSLMSFFVSHNHQRSTGSVELASADPLAAPVINVKYLQHQDDIDTNLDGIEMLQKHIAETLGDKVKLAEKPLTYCKKEKFGSRAYWTCALRYRLLTIFHPMGTCAMGDSAAESAVDRRLRVHGVEGLRVADASVLPTTVSANTHGPAVVIGLRAAELLVEERR